MFSPIGLNVFFCCSRYMVIYDDITNLTSHAIHRQCHSLLSSELISITYVLLELMSVRDGTFWVGAITY